MKPRAFVTFLFDSLLVILTFLGVQMYKQATFFPVLEKYTGSFLLFLAIWIIISLASRKYQLPGKKVHAFVITSKYIISSILVLGVSTTLMYVLRIDYYSRFVVLGTVIITTLIEVIVSLLFYWLKNATNFEPDLTFKNRKIKTQRLMVSRLQSSKDDQKNLLSLKEVAKRQELILEEISPKVYDFIFQYVPIDSRKTFILSTVTHLNIEFLTFSVIEAIVNLKRINDVRYLNKYFESINTKLQNGGILAGFLETKNQRKKRILRKYPPVMNYLVYTIDFIIKRVFPKFALTKNIYFILTRGQNRVITKAEAFGRLYSCGFEIMDEKESDGYQYFIAVKVKEPLYPESPTYGPFIQLPRVGKNGKIIKVYKLRTMHPYSEFLQDYMYKRGGLKEGGKFRGDFRVSNLGKIFRMFWLDELPMIINLLKGDLKIVGVRPLSKHYFSLYSKEFQKRRIQYKPGLVPPFYVDNPKTLEEIVESEKRYFDSYDRHPLLTDLRYFFKAFYNIVFKKRRSA
jgi:lipopolysaccharide/colanic/teichoic acid biosynthesis glycosyltransferase